jgi:hypothetical protein
MLRIGLSGTNWTGKTETIKRFLRMHRDILIETMALSPLVTRCPFPMGENQTLEASLWMIEQVKTLLGDSDAEVQVFDRTPLDVLAFTLYVQDHTHSKNREILDNARQLIVQFDAVFYAELSHEWPISVHVTPDRIRFARLMDSYLRKAIEEFQVDVVPLPWKLDERDRLLSQYVLGAMTV